MTRCTREVASSCGMSHPVLPKLGAKHYSVQKSYLIEDVMLAKTVLHINGSQQPIVLFGIIDPTDDPGAGIRTVGELKSCRISRCSAELTSRWEARKGRLSGIIPITVRAVTFNNGRSYHIYWGYLDESLPVPRAQILRRPVPLIISHFLHGLQVALTHFTGEAFKTFQPTLQ